MFFFKNTMDNNILKSVIISIQKEKYDEANKILQKLIKNDAHNPKYLNLLSIILINTNRHNEAISVLEKILEKNPDYLDALINIGNIYNDIKKYDKAEHYLNEAAKNDPNNRNLLIILATVLIHLSKFDKAEKILENLIITESNNVNILINLSLTKIENNKLESATKYLQKAITLKPDSYGAYYNFGLLEDKKGNTALAINHFLKAQSLNPKHEKSYYNLGCLYQQVGKINEAYKEFEKALTINKNYVDAKINLSRLQLAKHELTSGWEGYELRQGGVNKTYNILNIAKQNIWTGKKFNGELIVHGEQGLGDQILFSSVLEELKNFCNSIKVSVDKRLIPIMERSFKDVIFIDKMKPININNNNTKNILLGSLCQHLRKKTNDFKFNKTPWLRASKIKINKINNIFSFDKKIKVGLSWKGGSVKRVNRQIDITDLCSIFDEKKYELINLQHINYEDDIDLVSKKLNRKILYSKKLDYKDDLDSILALINECDLIITLGNTIGHLSSAIGKKTFVLVAPNAQWYWLSEHKKKLWYPNCNVIISKNNDNWSESISILENII